jgi:hypothetical protein
VGFPSADSFLATPRSQSVPEDFALPNISIATTGGSQMRKSFVALALLVGAATMLTTLAFAQETGDIRDQGAVLKSPSMMRDMAVTKAARLGASAATDTMFVGHTTGPVRSLPWNVGVGPYRSGVGGSYNGSWDWDTYINPDSLQGWVPYAAPNPRTLGTITDDLRSWNCLDWGNRLNSGPIQGRTPAIISAWHADNGVYPLNPGQELLGGSNSWTPLAGSQSAWCGLRAGNDFSVVDAIAYGGTGNHINGNVLYGRYGTNLLAQGGSNTQKNFPGYANQWDQMLYRDVRVASGQPLTVSFLYETQMDNRCDQTAATGSGWFDRDPLSLQQGGAGAGMNNFISNSAHLGVLPRLGPIDSFMVYVGVPTDPTAVQYSDGDVPRPIFDLKRRWFSEVIAIDMPYTEILSTFGRDSAFATAPFSATLDATVIQGMIDAQGEVSGGGVIRIVFRSKTNANFADEQNTGGSFNSTNKGAVRIDEVAFTTSGFEVAGEIDNNIEPANVATPGKNVGAGYALAAWHATGKPPKVAPHLHAMDGGGPSSYNPLAYGDLCGAWNSPIRQCNINNVILSMTDHDLLEAAGGADGTPFKEVRAGAISPTINLMTPPMPGVNECGIDELHVNTNDDWSVMYDIYTGIFADFYTQGNLHTTSLISYPTLQKNGAVIWGDIGVITSLSWWGDRYCLINWDLVSANINTSNASGIPDSVKIAFIREQRCISVGATNCSSTDGHYMDNAALVFPPPILGSADKVLVDIWDWFSDAFPRNQGVTLPGTAAFDTCGALISSAFQLATAATDLNRSSISGDSMFLRSNNSTGGEMRLDCVFRVFPGPGNYVTIGNKASGLRQVPTSATPAVSGDNSFWGQYLADPGLFSNGTHAGGWNVDTWNSVRCDTVERNLFPAIANNTNLPLITAGQWMSMMQDEEPKLAALGILKNRCFLIDPAPGTPVNSTNIDCATVPAWVTVGGTGYDGNQQTVEYTKIFPDGIFTPGTSIQYFYRMSLLSTPAAFAMNPDTNRIFPQPTDHVNFDGHRWESILILPDKWKDIAYGGLGSACMLVVDNQDRRGNERQWVSIADSIGATVAAKYGAHNGWHQTAGYVASDGSSNYNNEVNCGTDPNIAVWKNGGQPGTTWDLYNMHGIETASGSTTSLGSRLAPLASGFQTGKDTKQAPTPDMLKAYYNLLFFMCGDMSSAYFGAIPNKGAQDIEIVQDFLAASGNRGAWFMGETFVEAHDGYSTLHDTFLNVTLGCSLRDPSYYALSGSTVLYPDLIPSTVVNTTGVRYSVQNSCLFTNDVLYAEPLVGAVAATTYQDLGTAVGAIAGVYTANAGTHPYTTLVDGWNLRNMYNQGGGSSLGRLGYFMDVSTNVFGSFCGFKGTPTVDVPTNTAVNANIDFLGNVGNNPMVAGGSAIVRFGLAKADRVEVKVYDVTGRLVRTLANRNFQAGPQSLVWDGSNDQGQVVSRGVYFTQVKYANSGFVDARKVTILK